jgi:hypothetical protein
MLSMSGTKSAVAALMQLLSQPHLPSRSQPILEQRCTIAAGDANIEATFTLPENAPGVVVLLHASSAGRFEPASRFVAEVLGQAGFGTLQVDLLRPDEAASAAERPDPSLLATRALAALMWLKNQGEAGKLPVGLFVTPRETVAALIVAEQSGLVSAVVSLGGCPDYLMGSAPTRLCVPTLLIVGKKEQARGAELASEFFSRQLAQHVG